MTGYNEHGVHYIYYLGRKYKPLPAALRAGARVMSDSIEELRAAIGVLRTMRTYGDLDHPLADWLETAISVHLSHPEDATYESDHGYRWCTECIDEECAGLTQVDNALAVARVIYGGAS